MLCFVKTKSINFLNEKQKTQKCGLIYKYIFIFGAAMDIWIVENTTAIATRTGVLFDRKLIVKFCAETLIHVEMTIEITRKHTHSREQCKKKDEQPNKQESEQPCKTNRNK